MGYLKRRLSKIIWKFNFRFIEFVTESKKGQELITSPFSVYQTCPEVSYFVVYHLTIFDVLIQRRKEAKLDFFSEITIGKT